MQARIKPFEYSAECPRCDNNLLGGYTVEKNGDVIPHSEVVYCETCKKYVELLIFHAGTTGP
jgi:transcription elongation factor Elf1